MASSPVVLQHIFILSILVYFVILSEAKDLLSSHCRGQQVLRFSQGDNYALCCEIAWRDNKRARTNSTTSGVT